MKANEKKKKVWFPVLSSTNCKLTLKRNSHLTFTAQETQNRKPEKGAAGPKEGLEKKRSHLGPWWRR